MYLFYFDGFFLDVEASQNKKSAIYGWNIGGTNSSGQVPEIDNWPSLIDSSTPNDAKTFTNSKGDTYKLVFSDEFNEDGRSFYPGGSFSPLQPFVVLLSFQQRLI